MSHRQKIKVLEGIRQGMVGGGESVLLSLVENMDKDRFEPVVLSFTDGPMVVRLRAMGVQTHVIYTEKPFDFRVWGKVKQLLLHEKIDIVHAHGTRAQSNLYWAARSLNLPLIYTCHGWSFHQDQHPLIKKIRVLGEKWLTTRATQNICVSDANRREGVRVLGRRFDPVVIQNAVDSRKFNPDGKYKNIRSEFHINDSDILISFVGRLTWQKQPLVLINAFARAANDVAGLKLLMVGEGEQKPEAVEAIKKLNIGDKVILESFRQDVPDILAATDVFVLPSLWEGLPMALLEAMAMGKAIIASDVDGTSELIEDGKNGILITTKGMESKLQKALKLLCTKPALRESLGRSALQRTREHYDAQTMTARNEEIYLKLCKRPK